MRIQQHKFEKLHIGDSFIIGEMKEGSHVSIEVVSEIIHIANANFKGRKWGYISNRLNSFSTDPLVFINAKKLDHHLVAFASVNYREASDSVTKIEEQIVGDSFKYETFTNLDDAISWIKSLISTD